MTDCSRTFSFSRLQKPFLRCLSLVVLFYIPESCSRHSSTDRSKITYWHVRSVSLIVKEHQRKISPKPGSLKITKCRFCMTESSPCQRGGGGFFLVFSLEYLLDQLGRKRMKDLTPGTIIQSRSIATERFRGQLGLKKCEIPSLRPV
jgi:hypothetical protein